MAITRTAVGTTSDKGTSTTMTLSSRTPVVGSFLVVYLCGDSAASGVTFNGTAMSVLKSNRKAATVTGVIWTEIYGLDNVSGTGDIVATYAASTDAKAMAASCVTEVHAADKTAAAGGNSTSPSSGATTTTTNANEFLAGAVGTEGPDGDTAGSWSNSFTAGQRLGTTGGNANTNATISEGFRIVSSTGTYTAAKTGITSRHWSAVIVTLYSVASNASISAPVATASLAGVAPGLQITSYSAATPQSQSSTGSGGGDHVLTGTVTARRATRRRLPRRSRRLVMA